MKYNFVSHEVSENVYEMSNGSDVLIYAPLKGFVAKKWTHFSELQRRILLNVPNRFEIPTHAQSATVLELDMSHRCNLNCLYCSINANQEINGESKMSVELAKPAIDIVLQNAKDSNDKFCVVFIGKGEPTLNWDVLTSLADYIDRRKHDMKLDGEKVVVTNGIMSREKAYWLARHIEHVAVSWDGGATIQNSQRPAFKGGSSFKIVRDTVAIFSEVECLFEIRATWTDASVDQMVHCTEEFIRYRPAYLNYQPLLEIGRGADCGLRKPDSDVFADNFLESRKVARMAGMDIIIPYANPKKLNRKLCHAYEGTGFHLSAYGEVTACECVFQKNEPLGEIFAYGRMEGKQVVVDDHALAALREIKAENIAGCRNCFARWHCAGGCLNTHLQFSKNPLTERTHAECYIAKRIIWETLREEVERV